MNRIKYALMTAVMGATLFAAAGCGRAAAGSNKIPLSTKPHDGMVSGYRLLHPPNLPSDVKLYQIHYWSDHHQVEALMTEPTRAGHYPLLVNLHGGAIWPQPHWNFGYTPSGVAALTDPAVVQLYPEYQGYLGSSGPTQGIRTDYINAYDAIRIAQEFGEVKPRATYLLGYSLGGGLALMLAGVDPAVQAVVGVSPTVGLHDQAAWALSHPAVAAREGPFLREAFQLQPIYGTNVSGPAYQLRSPQPRSIHAPVLLLQGTADQEVAWQPVHLFYQQMQTAHRAVKLVLYPGGHHGLHGKYATQSAQQIHRWFAQYGLDIPSHDV